MLPERRSRHLVGVLGRHGEHNAALAQRQSHLLHGQGGRAGGIALRDLDALKPVIANHAAPNRVVQVQDEALAAAATQGCQQSADMVGINRQADVGKRQLGQVPLRRRVPGGKANRFSQRCHVKQEVRRAGHAIGNGPVQAFNHPAHGAGHQAVEAAEQAFRRWRYGWHDADRTGMAAEVFT